MKESLSFFLVLLAVGNLTLLNFLGRLDSPTSGNLFYREWVSGSAGEEVLTQYRQEVGGFVSQFYHLIPGRTALEDMGLIMEITRGPVSPEAALALVGLSERMNHFPAQLSGGAQQRVANAREIARQPQVLLCGEPKGQSTSA